MILDPGPRPRLTVAVPTCNGERHLAEALRSILAQGCVEFHFLLLDDRSEDETLAIARASGGDRLRIEVNSERLGLAGNWNRCVALSRTDWVAIFHQDDMMRPGHLATIRDQIALDGRGTGPPWGMICGRVETIDAAGRPVPPQVVTPTDLDELSADVTFPPGAFVRELAVGNPVRCSAVTLRKAAHDALGGFDPAYRYAVDWEFWLRLARRWAVRWLCRPTVAVRWHEASETHRFQAGTIDLEEQERLLSGVLAADVCSGPDARRLGRAARSRLGRAYLNRAYEAAKSGQEALGRRCLRQALRLSPTALAEILRDPRLAARLAWLWLASGRGGTAL